MKAILYHSTEEEMRRRTGRLADLKNGREMTDQLN